MVVIKDFVKKAEDCIVDNDEVAQKMTDSRKRRPLRLPHGHDKKKDAALSDYRDEMTLDEVAENDLAMTKDAIKNSKRYGFQTAKQAQAFMGRCVQTTLNGCGLMILEGMPAALVQRKMDSEKIQVESRTRDPNGGPGPFYKGDDSWRNGLYIYKKGELAAFISAPMIEGDSPFAINKDEIPRLEAFDRIMRDGKGAGLAREIAGIAGGVPKGIYFIITNARVSMKGFR